MKSVKGCSATLLTRFFRLLWKVTMSVHTYCKMMFEYFLSLILLLSRIFVFVYQGEPATTCSFCIFFFKTLEELLPKERTEVRHVLNSRKTSHFKSTEGRHVVLIWVTFLISDCRMPWSNCWKRFATSCRRLIVTSARSLLTSTAKRCWMQSWATPLRRPSVTSSTCAKARKLLSVSRHILVFGWVNITDSKFFSSKCPLRTMSDVNDLNIAAGLSHNLVILFYLYSTEYAHVFIYLSIYWNS